MSRSLTEVEHSAIARLKMLMDVGYKIDELAGKNILGGLYLSHRLKERADCPYLILRDDGLVEVSPESGGIGGLRIDSSDADGFWEIIKNAPAENFLEKLVSLMNPIVFAGVVFTACVSVLILVKALIDKFV